MIAMIGSLFGNSLYAQTSGELIPYLKGKLFGFADKNKRIVIEPQFLNAYPFGYSYDGALYPDVALVQKGEEMYLVDKEGKLIEQDVFNRQNRNELMMSMEEIPYRYSVFEENGKKGVKNKKNEIVVNPVYDKLELYYFGEKYYDKDLKLWLNPTFASVSIGEKRKIVRVDKYKEYKDISVSTYLSGVNYLIVNVKNGNKNIQNGVLTVDKLITVDSKYSKVIQFYEKQGLIEVYKVIDNHPVSIYIDTNGNEYYEK